MYVRRGTSDPVLRSGRDAPSKYLLRARSAKNTANGRGLKFSNLYSHEGRSFQKGLRNQVETDCCRKENSILLNRFYFFNIYISINITRTLGICAVFAVTAL